MSVASPPGVRRTRPRTQSLILLRQKELKNVQGDERDVMLFFKRAPWALIATAGVSMGFGPLNPTGGKCCLNVAVTRRKVALCGVFEPRRLDEIDLGRNQAVGVGHLKTQVRYASRGNVGHRRRLEPYGEGVEPPPRRVRLLAFGTRGTRFTAAVCCSGDRIDRGCCGIRSTPADTCLRSSVTARRTIPRRTPGSGIGFARVCSSRLVGASTGSGRQTGGWIPTGRWSGSGRPSRRQGLRLARRR